MKLSVPIEKHYKHKICSVFQRFVLKKKVKYLMNNLKLFTCSKDNILDILSSNIKVNVTFF